MIIPDFDANQAPLCSAEGAFSCITGVLIYTTAMLLLLISFLAGILTILAPCVLPVLPVMVGGTLSGKSKDRARPYVIVFSLAISIIFFTLLLKVSTVLVNLSPNVLTDFAGGLLIALGFTSAVPELWEKLIISLNLEAASLRFLGRSEKSQNQYVAPVLTGIALGPVFSSCSPTYAFILASVLPSSFAAGLIYLISYTLGLVVILLIILLSGRKYITRYPWAINTHSPFRRSLGLLFIVIGVALITGYQVKAELWVANHLPFDETKVEQVLLEKQQQHHTITHNLGNADVLNVQPVAAPQLQGLTNWVNSPPLMLTQLKGKVVLVDFWTYSCINCQRTLPYLEKWYQAYHRKGLVILGIDTPEFAFEHNPANVDAAVKRDGILYPVASDNNYDTWNAYDNDSWPADYLIDKSGTIRYVSLGEGDYGKTEQAIQLLLGIHQPLTTPTGAVPITQSQTPETYFGTNRDTDYVGSPSLNGGTATFTPASSLSNNQWTLGGTWNIGAQPITTVSGNNTLSFNVSAKDVYMVATNANGASDPVTVSLPSNVAGQYGSDAPGGTVTVNSARLYHIVALKQFGTTTITLHVPSGVSLYTFTFGS
jgi:cytochrome c biogenesis protein CcdA/thiol-disulfide isomerase/thioredoxin